MIGPRKKICPKSSSASFAERVAKKDKRLEAAKKRPLEAWWRGNWNKRKFSKMGGKLWLIGGNQFCKTGQLQPEGKGSGNIYRQNAAWRNFVKMWWGSGLGNDASSSPLPKFLSENIENMQNLPERLPHGSGFQIKSTKRNDVPQDLRGLKENDVRSEPNQ